MWAQVDVVCHGIASPPLPDPVTGGDPYAVPKRMGKFVFIDSRNEMTTTTIVERIIAHKYVAVLI